VPQTASQLRLPANLVRDHTAVNGAAHNAERLSERRGAAKLKCDSELLVAVPEQEDY